MKKILIVLIIGAILIGTGTFAYPDFKVDAVILKSVIKQGEVSGGNLKITNNGPEQVFQLTVDPNLISLDEIVFSLAEGESKNISILFGNSSLDTGIYTSKLTIEASGIKKEIPVIVEVQSKEVLFATNLDVWPEYREITGNTISANIKIFNLVDTKTHSIKIEYRIQDLNGETLVSETEDVLVGTETLTTKTLTLPENIGLGKYVLSVIVTANDSVSTSSYLFDIASKAEPAQEYDMFVLLLAIIVILVVIVLAFLIVYTIRDRDKMFRELRRQHLAEIKMLAKRLEEQKRSELARARTDIEKKMLARKYRRIKKNASIELRKRHKRQRKELMRLRKHKPSMEKILNEWKRQGFDVDALIVQMGAKPTNIKKQIKKWKKSGYDTSAIE